MLLNFIKDKIQQGEIIIIDKVLEECIYVAKGLVLKKLSFFTDKTFLKEAKIPLKTDSRIAPSPSSFLQQVDNQFVNSIIRKKNNLSDVEYENKKTLFLESADMKFIILCLNLLNKKIMRK